MDRSAIFQETARIIRDVLDRPDLVLDEHTTAQTVEGWDSFNHINIVVAVEARFGIKFQTAEIEELKNVGELVGLVAAKSGQRQPS
jgi:acyl carrier protein